MFLFIVHQLSFACHAEIFHCEVSLLVDVPVVILRNDWWSVIFGGWLCCFSIETWSKSARWCCLWKADPWSMTSFRTTCYWCSWLSLKPSLYLSIQIDNIFVLSEFVLIHATLWPRIVAVCVLLRCIRSSWIKLIHYVLSCIWPIIAEKRSIFERRHRRRWRICGVQQLSFVLILSWRWWQMLICLMLNWFGVWLLQSWVDAHSDSSLLCQIIILVFRAFQNWDWSSWLWAGERLGRSTATNHVRKTILDQLVLIVDFLLQFFISLLSNFLLLSNRNLTLGYLYLSVLATCATGKLKLLLDLRVQLGFVVCRVALL